MQQNSSTSQAFYHTIDVSFSEFLPDLLIQDETPTSGMLPKFPNDLFYPLAIQSSASGSCYLLLEVTLLALSLLAITLI
jgi:hypothetical protein